MGDPARWLHDTRGSVQHYTSVVVYSPSTVKKGENQRLKGVWKVTVLT